MDILEILLLVVAWFLTLGFAYGVRISAVGAGTALSSLALILASVFFTFFTELSKYHLLWVFPLSFLFGYFYSSVLILGGTFIWAPFNFLGWSYIKILRLGMSKEKSEQLEEKQKTNMEKLFIKKRKEWEEIERDKKE